jgi:hypothetical protein
MMFSITTLIRATLFLIIVLAQAAQNVSLPMALGGNDDMTVVLIYTALIAFVFFTLFDTALDLVCHVAGVSMDERHIPLNEPMLMLVSMCIASNGLGVVFGAAPNRTPLTLQMAILMVANLMTARLKIAVFGIKGFPVLSLNRFNRNYYAAWVLYGLSFLFVLIDRLAIAKTNDGSLSPLCLLFVGGILTGVMTNVMQDKLLHPLQEASRKQSNLVHFKQAVSLLRRQCTWLFVFTWVSPLVALIPGADQSGVLNATTFEQTFADFLPFTSLYMNIFNFAFVVVFVASVFLNRIDSALTNTASTVSGVVAIGAGWLPTIGIQVVGYSPNVPLTVAAMSMCLIGIIPSVNYSKALQEATSCDRIEMPSEEDALINVRV